MKVKKTKKMLKIKKKKKAQKMMNLRFKVYFLHKAKLEIKPIFQFIQ